MRGHPFPLSSACSPRHPNAAALCEQFKSFENKGLEQLGVTGPYVGCTFPTSLC